MKQGALSWKLDHGHWCTLGEQLQGVLGAGLLMFLFGMCVSALLVGRWEGMVTEGWVQQS